MIPAAAKCTACCDEPHWRSSVMPTTDSGQPAANTALRATLAACSPVWLTHPQITSSTSAGSIAGALDQRLEDVRRQVDGVDARQPSIALADGRAYGLDDDGIAHASMLRGPPTAARIRRPACLVAAAMCQIVS